MNYGDCKQLLKSHYISQKLGSIFNDLNYDLCRLAWIWLLCHHDKIINNEIIIYIQITQYHLTRIIDFNGSCSLMLTIKTYGKHHFSYIRAIAGWQHKLGHTPTNGLNSLADTFGVCACRPMHTHTTIHRAVTDSWQWRPALFFTVLFYKNYSKSKAAKLSVPLFGTDLFIIIIESRTYNANCCYCIMYVSFMIPDIVNFNTG